MKKVIVLLLAILFLFCSCKTETTDKEIIEEDTYVASINHAAKVLVSQRDSLLLLMDSAYSISDYERTVELRKEVDHCFESYIKFISVRTAAEYIQTNKMNSDRVWLSKGGYLFDDYTNYRDSSFMNLVDFCIDAADYSFSKTK